MENSGVFFLRLSHCLMNKQRINEEIERHESMPRMDANLAQSRGNPVPVGNQNYPQSSKRENGQETTEKQLKNCKESC